MHSKVPRVCWFLSVCLLILPGFELSSALAQENSKSTSSADAKISLYRTITTACAEKTVRLQGEFETQFSVTRDASGDTLLRADFNAERITAFGVTSGRKYLANGTSRFDSRGPSPAAFTYVFNFALNKVKSFDSLMGHAKFRIKVDARAQATGEIIELILDCNH